MAEKTEIRIAIRQKRRSADDIRSLNAIVLIRSHERFNREPSMSERAISCLSSSLYVSSLLMCIQVSKRHSAQSQSLPSLEMSSDGEWTIEASIGRHSVTMSTRQRLHACRILSGTHIQSCDPQRSNGFLRSEECLEMQMHS